jgi:hypothetical protein
MVIATTWTNRQLSFGNGVEILTLAVGIFALLVMLLPAGWLYASTISLRARAAAVAAWNALIVCGCALGMRFPAVLELPITAGALAVLAVAYFQRDRIAVQYRLALDVIRRWAAPLGRVRAAAPTPAPAR